MGLSKIEITFFDLALKMGIIPTRGHILELGESNLIPADAAADLLSILAPRIPRSRIEEAARRAAAAVASRSRYQKSFGPARALYHAIFDPASYTALDLDQGPRRFCLDLNGPISLQQQFDCVINNGTSEHIFDQANVFRVIHDHTRVGGVMIHWTPCLGWANHGLYNVQPGFFFDLAAANGYEVSLIALTSADICVPILSGGEFWQAVQMHPVLKDAAVCAVLRKEADTSFAAPVQGIWNYQSPALQLASMPRRRTLQMRCNLAQGRPALQSSTSIWSWHDDPALDAAGGNNGQVTGFFSFHTDFDDEPWWMVDLGGTLPITEVFVYNRLDGEQWARRAAHLCVSLSDDAKIWHNVFSRKDDTAFGGADGSPLRIKLPSESGRYVRVFLPERGVLHLDEIEVY